jgi:ATP-dependent Lon protease
MDDIEDDEDDSDEETVYEDIDEEEDDEEEDDDDDEEEEGDGKNYQITLTIGGNGATTGLTRVASNASCDDEYGSDDEKTFMKENYETMEQIPEAESAVPEVSKSKSKDEKKSKSKSKDDNEEPVSETVDIEDKYKEIIELKKVLLEKLRAKPKNTIIQKALKQCEHSIKKLIKHARTKNTKTYEDLLSNPETQEYADEISFFKKKMSNKEQLRIMNDLKEVNNYMFVDKPYRLSLLQSKIPPKLKATALQKLNVLNQMEPGVDNEYYKLKNWVDTFMRIPFGINKSLTITMADGIDKCSDFVVQAKNQLDSCVYGLNDAKMQIMQMIGQWISNPKSLGTAIAIHGPPGTGKTSLIKDGISKILGREFAFIALGGCGDSSFLEGHSYTYEGSTWGKIAQILIESKCMNPVIYFDELDKISDTPRGQEIIGILTHLTDTSQNSQFHDKYFSEIDFDLSKCLFIFSYNDANLVNPVLRDRMYKIKTNGYDAKEKITIAKKHLLPKIREQVGFNEEEVIIPDEVLSHIINNQAKGEDGVRNLKRCLEVIHTKLNLYRLVKSGTGVFDKDMGLSVSFPYTVSKKDVDNLIKMEEGMSQSVLCSMYM